MSEVTSPQPVAAPKPRLDSIDALRGFVMIIMALDHARGFFSNATFPPLDLDQGHAGWFFTRWITHYCAPCFFFLAGAGAFLAMGRGKTKKDLFHFLWTRGVWMIFLELTVVKLGWTFQLDYKNPSAMLMIWAIGWSMLILSLLIWLPFQWIMLYALVIVFGHNLLDPLDGKDLGAFNSWWIVLHKPGLVNPVGDFKLSILYPFLAWSGIVSGGFVFGAIYRWEADRRRWFLLTAGSIAVIAFFVLRLTGIYGDPQPWKPSIPVWKSALRVLDCQKYPPSLLYVLMTIGPAMFLLAWFERVQWKGLFAPVVIFGRVPMFFFLLHIFLTHGLAKLINTKFELPGIYAMWVLIVFLLYWPCRWFADLKKRRRDAWLGYF